MLVYDFLIKNAYYSACLDDWPVSNLLVGLAHYGDYREFIRILCGHLALHQARGTFFAPEMSFRDRLDSTHCVPSQLTVALALQALETAWLGQGGRIQAQ